MPLTGSSWSADSPLVTGPSRDKDPYVLGTSDGRYWFFFSSDKTGRFQVYYNIYFGAWRSSGATQLTTHISDNQAPTAAQSKNGTVWAAWQSSRNGPSQIYYKTLSGPSWSSDRRFSTSTFDVKPSLTSLSDGRVLLVWDSLTVVSGQITSYALVYSIYDTAWSSPVTILNVPAPAIVQDPVVRQTADGQIWLFWSSNSETCRGQSQSVIFYRKGTVSSSITWTTPDIRLARDNNCGEDFNPSFTQSANGTLWLFLERQTLLQTGDLDGDLYFVKSLDGSTWSSVAGFAVDSSFDDLEPTVWAGDTFWAVWTSTRPDGSALDIYYRTDPPIGGVDSLQGGFCHYATHCMT